MTNDDKPAGRHSPQAAELDAATKARIRAEEVERLRVRAELVGESKPPVPATPASVLKLAPKNYVPPSAKEQWASARVGLVFAVILALIIYGCAIRPITNPAPAQPAAATPAPIPEAMSYVTFHRTCTELVSKQLKAPATAVYPDSLTEQDNGDLTGTGETGFTWNGYVDAQNSFGANLRTPFICTSDPGTFMVRLKSFDGQ